MNSNKGLSTNVADIRYLACWTERDGIYCCGHLHTTIADAMNCLVPDGRSFIRAMDGDVSRSLNDGEVGEFLIALKNMPWSARFRPRTVSNEEDTLECS